MKAVVFTLGCKVNEVESASIMNALCQLGWQVSAELGRADVYILNTCAVTREAEKKSRQLVARVRKFNPAAPVYVCGCASEKNGGQFADKGVKFVCGARDKQRVLDAIAEDFGCGAHIVAGLPKQMRTRAFVKIGDGCNNFCSYCIIPYLRGRVTSRSVKDIVEEIALTQSDEVVLTAINISAYGKDTGSSLTELMSALKDTDKRIRLGSLECGIIDEQFLESCKELKDFAPQFHLSLQSGSDEVLRRMNRHYTRAEYLEKCALIYKYFPDAAITTDIIAGFCSETDKDFSDSLSIIKEAGFARVHAFAYSPREGTKAYSLQDIPAPIKDKRLHALIAEGDRAEKEFIASRFGKTREVIFEDFDGRYTDGYTPEYIRVYVEGRHSGRASVTLKSAFRDGALGIM